MATYYPGQGINQAGQGYNIQNYGQFNNTAYDNSSFANLSNFNQITPFEAWAKTNFLGIGSPPPGMSQGDYSERVNTLSSRFSQYALPSMFGSAASVAGTMYLQYPELISAASAAKNYLTGSAAVAASQQAASTAATASNAISFGSQVMSGMTNMFYKPASFFAESYVAPIASQFGTAAVNAGNTLGNAIGFNNMGSVAAQGTANLFNPTGTVGKAIATHGGISGAMGQAMFKAPAFLAANVAGFVATQAAINTVIQGGINSLVGIDFEEDKIADTFESLSSRVLSGPSGFRSKAFARDMAKEIRARAFSDAKAEGVLSYFGGISDSYMGRFTGGWDAIREMNVKTAQYGLMAESGLLTKSNSADEFIKKADAMYSAISKLGEALGQTTTKAMETARVLKSQGMSDPNQIAMAGNTISTSGAMTGFSNRQVMALTGEATEAFRGTLFGANMGFNMANSVMRKMSIGQELIGDEAYDRTMYALRGQDSANVLAVKAMSGLYNASELKSMVVGSMFQETDSGYRFTGKINQQALDAAMSGQSNYLTDESTLALLTGNFAGMNKNTKRLAERNIASYTNNLSNTDMMGMLSAVGRMRGYESNQDMLEQRFREFGLDPNAAYNMSKILTQDTRQQEAYFDYFQRKDRQLSQMIAGANANIGKSSLSEMTFGYHKTLGKATAFAEISGLAMTGAAFGGIPGALVGAGIGIYSSRDEFARIGANMGFSDETSMAAGLAGYAGAYGLMGYGIKGAVGAGMASGVIAGVASGLGAGIAGYAGYKAGSFVYDRYMKDEGYGKQWRVGASALSGGAIGAGAAMLLGGPVGWVAGAGMLVGAGLSYLDTYGGTQDVSSQRQRLRERMQILTGAASYQSKDAMGYAELMSRGMDRYQSIQDASISEYTKGIDSIDQSEAADIAAKMVRQSTKGKNAAEAVLDSDDSFILGDVERKRTGILNYFGYRPKYKTSDYLEYLGGVKSIKVGSKSEKALSRIRAVMSHLPERERKQMASQLREYGLDDLKFTDSNGNTLFKGSDEYMNASLRDSYSSVSDRVASELDDANKLLNSALGRKSGSMINATNAAAMFGVINSFGTGKYKDRLKDLEAISPDTAKRLALLLKGRGSELAAVRDELSGHLSTAVITAEQGVMAEALNTFKLQKSSILGSNVAGTVADLMDASLRRDFIGDELAAVKGAVGKGGFKSVTDKATRGYLRQMSSANDLFANLGGVETSGQFMAKIKADKNLNPATKQLLISQLPSDKGEIIGSNIDTMVKRMGASITSSYMASMSQQTAESMQARQGEILTKLDKTLEDLTTAINKANGVATPADPGKGKGVGLQSSQKTDN